jgi:hypothetical protein
MPHRADVALPHHLLAAHYGGPVAGVLFYAQVHAVEGVAPALGDAIDHAVCQGV